MPFHPVTADDINAKLRAIESEHQVHVLLACESGSRSFGFESPESDYDVLFIFVRRTTAVQNKPCYGVSSTH